jgi:serine/threonine protein kinase
MHEAPWQPKWEALPSRSRSGGQGSVTQVRRRSDGALGALKVLHPTYLRDDERRLRMAREVDALRRVEGAGIPKILDANTDAVADTDVPLYFIAEWVQGLTLQQYAGGLPRSLGESIRLAIELTRVVERCHSVGVLHRDIKPDNIILNPDDAVLTLVDFGIAWTNANDDSLITELGQEPGNRFLRVPDMAPGQMRHDPRTDLTFVVGILFFLLTGRAPRFLVDQNVRKPHEAFIGTFDQSILDDPRWELVRRILNVGFEIDIGLRFQTAPDLLQRLEEIAHQDRAEPHSASPSQVALQAFHDFLSTEIARSFERIMIAMLDASRRLEDALEAKARDAGLRSIHLAGRSRVDQCGRRVYFAYDITRADVGSPGARLQHSVTFVGEGH